MRAMYLDQVRSVIMERIENLIREQHSPNPELSEAASYAELQLEFTLTDIENLPLVDVEPVRHGHWIDKYKSCHGMQSWCSVCEKRSGIGGIESNRHRAYCPNCGAKMDVGEKNETD